MLREVVDALGLIRLSSSAHFSVKTRVQKLEGGGGGHLQDASAKFDLALRVLEEVGGIKAVEERDQDGQVGIELIAVLRGVTVSLVYLRS